MSAASFEWRWGRVSGFCDGCGKQVSEGWACGSGPRN